MTTLAAAFPTNQSPAATSMGAPFREYGWTEVDIMGNLENIASPAPRAPLPGGGYLYHKVGTRKLYCTYGRILSEGVV